jgi:hypothetical protein
MKYILLITLCSFNLFTKGQESYYDFIDLGEFQINYDDTVINDYEIPYNQFGYSGDAPLFVQVWFPAQTKKSSKYLKFGDFVINDVPSSLAPVYKELQNQMDQIVIRDGIAYNAETDEPIPYAENVKTQMLERLKRIETRSIRASLPSQLDYPVIVYHHGSQGLSNENSIMAEYFASMGYIFISANFHLPYENTQYGLLPYQIEKENKHNQSSAKALLNFAKSLSPENQLFYIGHSWGAQEGWCFLNDPTCVNGFVSMETTIEYWSDTLKIKETWPYVYDAIKTKNNLFSTPILTFAAVEEGLTFEFFEGINSEETICASYKNFFAHNSYTSMYLMRYFLSREINQPDSGFLLTQIEGYIAHLKLIYMFTESILNDEGLVLSNFRESFQIKRMPTINKRH